MAEIIHAGAVASRGLALGRVQRYDKAKRTAARTLIAPEQAGGEMARYRRAADAAVAELSALAEKNQLFSAHIGLLGDFALVGSITENIEAGLQNAELAVENAVHTFSAMLADMDDAYMRERCADLLDLGDRLLRILQNGGEHTMDLAAEGPLIIVADDLAPSDTAKMDLDKVVGFITGRGGATGHVAIMARSMGIPALVGASGVLDRVQNGDEIILDALVGDIVLHPTDELRNRYIVKKAKWDRELEALLAAGDTPAVTVDGHQVKVYANAGGLADVRRAAACGADGIGLFRTEFLYMDSDHFPTEEEQFAVYRAAAEAFDGEITIRTLDIGGDKVLPYFPFEPEDNPFLGWRAIRICLDMPEVFKTQLRAILRASDFGELRIMFPMLISLEELEAAKAVLTDCMEELAAEGIPFNREIPVGMMVETPAAVILAEAFARQVAFFSIGTNDLTQYTLAADRGNEKIAPLYDSLHPAVLRSIATVITAGHAAGIEVGMCGEFAADQRATRYLVGAGLDELSVAAGDVSAVKQRIRDIRLKDARATAQELLGFNRRRDIEVGTGAAQ